MPWLTAKAGAPVAAELAQGDAYLPWAQATDFRDYVNARGETPASLPALLELAPDKPGAKTFDAAHAWLREAQAKGTLTVPALYCADKPRHVTVTLNGLQPDPLRNTHVKRFEIGLPLRAPVAPPAANGQPSPSAASPSASKAGEPGVVIGMIDDRCAFAHPAFLDDRQRSRFLALWDQGGREGPPWTVPADLGYGSELRQSELSRLVQEYTGRPRELYRAVDMSDLLDSAQLHGTFGLDIAAGYPDPRGAAGAPRDAAGKCDLVFVQVPRAGFSDVSGAWLCVHVLDAVHYILARAKADDRVVVNLALGAYAGPHDGSSLLEQALDEVIAAHAGRLAVVVAAGNGRDARVHAQLEVPAGGAATTLWWDLSRRDPTPSFLELWYAGPALSVRVIPAVYPETTPRWIEAGEQAMWRSPGAPEDSIGLGLVHAGATANGRGSLILLTVAATAGTMEPPEPRAHNGVYAIELRNQGSKPVVVKGWIERDDPSPLDVSKGRWQSSLGPAGSVVEADTLSSIACGRQTIVVGATYAADGTHAPYSGHGPARGGRGVRRGPDVMAPGQHDRTRFFAAAGVTPDRPQKLWGTSAAAAVVTRRIANLFGGPKPPKTIAALKKRLASYPD